MPDQVIQFEFRTQRFEDAAAGLRAFSKDLEDRFSRVPKTIKRELTEYLNNVAEALAQRHGNPWPGGTGAKTLSRRSGEGIKSIRESVRVTGSTLADIEGRIGGKSYLKIQETGGTINAKAGKYLTIPLPAALNSNGTPKKPSARDWDRTFVAKSRNGNLIIFQRTGSGIIPLYVLKKSVKIPARLGMQETLIKGLPYFVDKALDAALKDIKA